MKATKAKTGNRSKGASLHVRMHSDTLKRIRKAAELQLDPEGRPHPFGNVVTEALVDWAGRVFERKSKKSQDKG